VRCEWRSGGGDGATRGYGGVVVRLQPGPVAPLHPSSAALLSARLGRRPCRAFSVALEPSTPSPPTTLR
jgi:hypothetical protein